MALFFSTFQVSHDSAQYQDPETKAAKGNSVIINLVNFIIYTFGFPTDEPKMDYTLVP